MTWRLITVKYFKDPENKITEKDFGRVHICLRKAYLKPCQTSEIKLFAKIVNGFHPLTIFAKSSIFDVWESSEYASPWDTGRYVTCQTSTSPLIFFTNRVCWNALIISSIYKQFSWKYITKANENLNNVKICYKKVVFWWMINSKPFQRQHRIVFANELFECVWPICGVGA